VGTVVSNFKNICIQGMGALEEIYHRIDGILLQIALKQK